MFSRFRYDQETSHMAFDALGADVIGLLLLPPEQTFDMTSGGILLKFLSYHHTFTTSRISQTQIRLYQP